MLVLLLSFCVIFPSSNAAGLVKVCDYHCFITPNFIFLVGDITLIHTSDGCCGQMQRVLCNAIDSFLVDVLVENKLVMGFTSATIDRVVEGEGITTRVINATTATGNRKNFLVEITFTALSNSVTLTCDTAISMVTRNITTTSKFSCHEV